MTLRCFFDWHNHRDENNWPIPHWYCIVREHRYVCTRCGDVRTLRPGEA